MSVPVNITPGSYEVFRYAGNPASIGANELVAANSTKRILVVGAFFSASGGAQNVIFRSGGSTALTGAMDVPADWLYVLPWNPVGWFVTAKGEALNLVLTAATSFGITVLYQLVD